MMMDTIHACDLIVQIAGLLLHDPVFFLIFGIFALFRTFITEEPVIRVPLGEFHFSGIIKAHTDQFLL